MSRLFASVLDKKLSILATYFNNKKLFIFREFINNLKHDKKIHAFRER